jgi:glutamate-5-semialdehyde dehydrogenase
MIDQTTPDSIPLIRSLGQAARQAQAYLSMAPDSQKTAALLAAATALRAASAEILAANAADMAASVDLGAALRDRLFLDEKRLEAIAASLEMIAALPDPVGGIIAEWTQPNGLHIQRVRVPLGVIGIIYESRPNVTIDAGALCLKAGCAAILRGGSEALRTSRALHAAFVSGLVIAGLPAAAVQLVPTADRAAVGAMLTQADLIDVIIPRGGKSLIARVQADSRVPVLAHLDGNNHVYLHAAAHPEKALAIVVNAKMRRTGVCGAAETLLIDQAIAGKILPRLIETLHEKGCELRGDDAVQAFSPLVIPATLEDWGTEYLAPILALKVVAGLDDAIAHIARYGSHHTDAIVTEDPAAAADFLARVDSAIVLHNASTQFADGGEFGMGAEIGIATGRLHARGPVGVEQLTTFKYVVHGTGQVRK